MQAQNGVNMASGTATTAPSTATTAPSTAPLPLVAGPSIMEPIVPIGAQMGAQDTPSVIQGARLAISTEQTMQSTQRYATLPYISGQLYTAPLPSTAPLPYAAYTAPLPYAAMPAMSARPSVPMGYYGQGNQFPFMPNWMMTEREQMLQQQLLQERQQFEAALRASQAQPQPQPPISSLGSSLKLGTMLILMLKGQPVLRGLDLKTRPLTRLNVQGLLQHLADPPLPRGTTLGGLAQPLGHLRPVPNGLSIHYLLLRTVKPLKLT